MNHRFTSARATSAAALALGVLTLCSCASTQSPPAAWPQSAESSTQDLQAARALFERNIRAIQEKSKADYLDCYWPEPSLVRVGVAGPALGFRELAESTSEDPSEWPISLEAHDLDLHRVAPGVVYGIYRYVVVYPDKPPATGWSERVFVKRNNRWWIAVTTAFDTLPEEPASDDEP